MKQSYEDGGILQGLLDLGGCAEIVERLLYSTLHSFIQYAF